MQKKKLGFQESLGDLVVEAGRCVGCGACVVTCPFQCLDYVSGKPKLLKECQDCGICPRVCPRYEASLDKLENFVFNRTRREEEFFGIHQRIVIAQAVDPAILSRCQDGGVVTAIVTYGLNHGLFDGAALSGVSRDKPLFPVPKMVDTPDDALDSAGTRYAYSPNLLAIREGIVKRKKSIVFIGTPCQVQAIRRIQKFPLKKYAKSLKLIIGLMCTESFDYRGFFEEYVHEILGIDLKTIKKVNIKGKILLTLDSGEIKSVSLSDAKKYVRESCHICRDFSAELADISVGGLGLNGWTFVILRTKEGEEIFNKAVKAGTLKVRSIDEEPFAQKLLKRLTDKKHSA